MDASVECYSRNWLSLQRMYLICALASSSFADNGLQKKIAAFGWAFRGGWRWQPMSANGWPAKGEARDDSRDHEIEEGKCPIFSACMQRSATRDL
jgi:hypothetical protein